MTRVRTVVAGLLAVGVLAIASSAFAQDALLVGGQFVSATRNFGAPLSPGMPLHPDSVFGGGRYAIFTIPQYNSYLLDVRTGATRGIQGQIVAVDRARPHLFVLRNWVDSVWLVNVATGQERRVFGQTSWCAHAYSVNALFCTTERTDGRVDVHAVDVNTGASRVVGVLPAGPLLATPDGRRVFTSWTTTAPYHAMLDVESGRVVTSDTSVEQLTYDEVNDRIFGFRGVGRMTGRHTIVAFTKDLERLGEMSLNQANWCAQVDVSPHTGRLYINEFAFDAAGGGHGSLWAFDSASFAPLEPVVRRDGVDQPRCGVTVLTAPGRPRHVTATTATGGYVDLSWTNVGAASNFVLDVGVGPGRTDLSVLVGTEPRAVFVGVPPGTYYVRVRGGNEFGGGRPSQETQVVIR